MARIDYTTDPDVDERLNPASEQTSKYLNSMENNAANDNFYDGDKKDDGLNAADSVNSQEQLYSRSPLGEAGGKKRGNLLANMSRRKWGATAGIGGGLFGLMMLFFSILPYKLDAMVSTTARYQSTTRVYHHSLGRYENDANRISWRCQSRVLCWRWCFVSPGSYKI